MKGIKANPNYRKDSINRNYRALRKIISKNKTVQRRVKDFISAFKEQKPEHSKNLIDFSNEEIVRWVRSDLNEIINRTKEEDIELILHNYHPLPHGSIPGINKVIEQTAEKRNITFVNNHELFEDIFRSQKRKKYYHLVNGKIGNHLNENGYRLMAKRFMKKILRKKDFEFQK